MPSRWNKLRHLWRFADDWKSIGPLHFRPFPATFRFSARVWWLGRGTQTWQQFVHPASHLLRRRRTLLVFPRTQFRLNQRTAQHQMIVTNRDDLSPTLTLFRPAYP